MFTWYIMASALAGTLAKGVPYWAGSVLTGGDGVVPDLLQAKNRMVITRKENFFISFFGALK
jgi:hypothetical protein